MVLITDTHVTEDSSIDWSLKHCEWWEKWFSSDQTVLRCMYGSMAVAEHIQQQLMCGYPVNKNTYSSNYRITRIHRKPALIDTLSSSNMKHGNDFCKDCCTSTLVGCSFICMCVCVCAWSNTHMPMIGYNLLQFGISSVRRKFSKWKRITTPTMWKSLEDIRYRHRR